jgi:energy-coupling factor transporter ATP-binding protein EcfA2
MNVIEIENVTKTFGDIRAIDGLSLNVPRGAIYGFIGPNGSGKATTLRMIVNIFYPDSGKIRVFDEEIRGANTSRIGYLPEERGLYKKMKVRDLLRFYGELKSGRSVNRNVEDWLERLGRELWGAGIQPVRPGTWIPASAGMTGRSEGMTRENAGMTGRSAGVTGRSEGMTRENAGMTGRSAGVTGRSEGMTGENAGIQPIQNGHGLSFPSSPPLFLSSPRRRGSSQSKTDMAFLFRHPRFFLSSPRRRGSRIKKSYSGRRS